MKHDIIKQVLRRTQVAMAQLTYEERIKHAEEIQYELERIANRLREENFSATLAAVYDLEQLMKGPARKELLQKISGELDETEQQALNRECYWNEQIHPKLQALQRFIALAKLTPPEKFNAERVQAEWAKQVQATKEAIKSIRIRKRRATQRELKQAAELILMLGK